MAQSLRGRLDMPLPKVCDDRASAARTLCMVKLLLQYALTCMLLLSSLLCYGQYESVKGGFTVDQKKGCVPLRVEVSDDLPDGDPGNYAFDFKSIEALKSQINPKQDTTYTKPGIYTIFLLTNDNGGDSIHIEVLDTLPPQYRAYQCENHGVYVDFSQENYYDSLYISFGDGADTTLATNAPPDGIAHAYDMPGEYIINVTGIFADAASNCAVASTTFRTTEELSPAGITQVAVLSQDSIQVSYLPGTPDVSYQLQVAQDGEDFSNATSYDIDASLDSLIIDGLDDTRQHYYCFRIITLNRCDPNDVPQPATTSDTLCSIALQPTAVHLQNNLEWQTQPGAFGSYNVTRDGAPKLDNTPETRYKDSVDIVCQVVYRYQVTSQKGTMQSISEQVAVTAISTKVSPALTSFSVTPAKALRLIWNVQEAPATTKYYIYRGDSSSNLQLYDSVDFQNSTVPVEALAPDGIFMYLDSLVEVEKTYCYQLSYIDACGNESARRSTPYCVKVPRQAKIVFPNAFTPDGDGLNDVFLYKGNLIDRIELRIFNRWGEMLFQTDQVDVGWDGSYKGSKVPEGVYLYRANITDQLGNSFTMQGSLTLLIP